MESSPSIHPTVKQCTKQLLQDNDVGWHCHHLVVPRHNLSTYGRRAFAVAGPAAWNSLSDDLRDPALSTDGFRRVLKTRLFSEY